MHALFFSVCSSFVEDTFIVLVVLRCYLEPTAESCTVRKWPYGQRRRARLLRGVLEASRRRRRVGVYGYDSIRPYNPLHPRDCGSPSPLAKSSHVQLRRHALLLEQRPGVKPSYLRLAVASASARCSTASRARNLRLRDRTPQRSSARTISPAHSSLSSFMSASAKPARRDRARVEQPDALEAVARLAVRDGDDGGGGGEYERHRPAMLAHSTPMRARRWQQHRDNPNVEGAATR